MKLEGGVRISQPMPTCEASSIALPAISHLLLLILCLNRLNDTTLGLHGNLRTYFGFDPAVNTCSQTALTKHSPHLGVFKIGLNKGRII